MSEQTLQARIDALNYILSTERQSRDVIRESAIREFAKKLCVNRGESDPVRLAVDEQLQKMFEGKMK